jgi:hypothetical protein
VQVPEQKPAMRWIVPEDFQHRGQAAPVSKDGSDSGSRR